MKRYTFAELNPQAQQTANHALSSLGHADMPGRYADMPDRHIMFTKDGMYISRNSIKEEPLQDVFISVPSARQVIRIAEGTGDNLMNEDIEAGYCDYLMYEQYGLGQGMPEADGGMVLLSAYAYEKYDTLIDAVPDILDMAYGKEDLDFTVM